MAPFNKDSAIIVIRAAADGYFTEVYQWTGVSPPPIPYRDLANTDPAPTILNHVQSSKAELLAEFTAWLNGIFDQ